MNKLLKQYKQISLPAKASLWFIICSLIQKGIAFITTPFFTRMMTTTSYGIVVIYNSWLDIMTIFATFQLATGVFNKAMIKYKHDRDRYTSSSLFLASCITILILLLYLLSPQLWNSILDLPSSMVVMMFIEIFFTSAMSFWSIRNRFEYKYKSVILFTLLVAIIGPLSSMLMISIAPEKNQAEAKIFGMLFIKIVLYTIIYIAIIRRGKKIIDISYWKYSLAYNLPLIPHYLSQQVLTQSDRIMIDRICGKPDAAIYGVAYQLSMAIFLVTLAIHNSFTPWTFENLKTKKYKEIGKSAVEIELAIGIGCFVFSLFAPELIFILGGEKYIDAVWIVPPVTMSVLFQTIYTYFGNIEFYFEKTKLVMTASLIIAVINVLMNAIFIPLYGFVAAGYTTLACYVLYSAIHYIFMLKICKNENVPEIYNGKLIWSIGFFCIILSFSASFLYNYQILRYMVSGTLAIIIGSIVIINRENIVKMIK